MRIVSLLPSITELISSLGLESSLVGRSHECDFPPSVRSLPVCTETKYIENGTGIEIDQSIKSLLENGLSIYNVRSGKLADLKPDIILTQDHCDVCAVSLADVEKALEEWIDYRIKVISVSPTNLSEIFNSIHLIARSLQVEQKGLELANHLKQKKQKLKSRLSRHKHPLPNVVCIEWLDPLMTAGNWIPELIELAGGKVLLSTAGAHSPAVEWTEIQRANPDIVLIIPCGYTIQDTLKEMSTLVNRKGWDQLKAVNKGEVYLLDGNHYFNRPGPRIIDSALILAEIFHPDLFKSTFKGRGWVNLFETPVDTL